MGMDVYVGPLTRYTLGEWLTVVQQAGMANGVQVDVWRPESLAPTEPAEVEAAVSTWQLELLEALGDGDPWADSPDLPHWTDKPDRDGYGGLVLAAAYAERPDLSPVGTRGVFRRGVTDDPRTFESSAAYIEASKAGYGRFGLAVFLGLAAKAYVERQPLLLDS